VWAGGTGFAGDIGQETPLHALGHAARVTAVGDDETAVCANGGRTARLSAMLSSINTRVSHGNRL
jgi:hypothetical protein